MNEIFGDAEGTREKTRSLAREGCGSAVESSDRLRGRLVRLAYRFLWDHNEAEDAVQDALTAAYQHQADLRELPRI